MDDNAFIFSELRDRLFAIAYQMLGIRADAEDVLQDAYIRWQASDAGDVRSTEAWLTTIVKRLAIDRLRRAQVRRDAYVGPWLPEPLAASDLQTPEEAAELRSDVSIAFLAVLETLTPDERAAFLMREVLDDDYSDIAGLTGKSEAACRQLVHRSRVRLAQRGRRYTVDDATRTRVLRKFIDSANSGDRTALLEVLADDSRHISDGGGKGIAALRPLYGAERIAWLWHAVARRVNDRLTRNIVRVNGEPGLVILIDDKLHSVATVDTDGQRILAYYAIANPDKLARFARASSLSLFGEIAA